MVLTLGLSPSARAQTAPDSSQTDREGFFDRIKRPKLERWGFVYLPKVYYASQTGVGIGGQVLRPFSGHGLDNSEVDIGGRVTVKGQGEADFTVNLAWGGGRYASKTRVEFSNIPRYFYGIGPDTPDSAKEPFQRQSLLYYLEVMRTVGPRLRVGLRGEIEQARMLEAQPDGLFATTDVRGFDPSTVIGWGVTTDWDTRDHRYWPTRGSYHQAFFLKFDDGVRSDHNFDVYYVELRKYFETATDHVLALQAFMYAVDGKAPFWRLAEMGGRAHSRGYERGRYRDNVLVAFQAEHRFQVWGRFGLAGFAGLADVAPRLEALQIEHMRPTFGGGIRFRLGSGEKRVNARLDVAYGDDFHLYFKLGEAF